MKEIVDFRITEDRAARVLRPEDGVPLGGVRKLQVPVDDERVQLVVRAAAEARDRGEIFASFAQVRRRYTRNELDGADRLWLEITSTFETEGEACGTIYDDSAACPECGACAPQRNLLRLDARRPPRLAPTSRSPAKWSALGAACCAQRRC